MYDEASVVMPSEVDQFHRRSSLPPAFVLVHGQTLLEAKIGCSDQTGRRDHLAFQLGGKRLEVRAGETVLNSGDIELSNNQHSHRAR